MVDPIARFLNRHADLDRWPVIGTAPEAIKAAVVIPCLAERANLFDTLRSLSQNPDEHLQRTIVICVVNNRAAPHAPIADIEDNAATLNDLRAQIACARNELAGLHLMYVDASTPGNEFAPKDGVGLARKIGLDHGLALLARSPSPARILCSLDADTLVQPNYLEALSDFAQRKAWAGVVHFEHRLPEDPVARNAIIQYELFLRCHVIGLLMAGSPFAFHSIGSTMVCTPEAYAAVSGMNRRQAGEDFYFLEKLAKTGTVVPIANTTVFPSARTSHRVPFGTGRNMQQAAADGAVKQPFYNPQSYKVLRRWLEIGYTVERDPEAILTEVESFSPSAAAFLRAQGFAAAWAQITANARTNEQQRRQFHTWFDGFRTLKLFHWLRDNGNPDVDFQEHWRNADPMRILARYDDGSDMEACLFKLRAYERGTAKGFRGGICGASFCR